MSQILLWRKTLPMSQAMGPTVTPINLTNAAGRNIFSLIGQSSSSSWLFSVGNPTVPQDISDVVFYSSGTGFFQWQVAGNSYVSFQSSGGAAQAIQVQRGAAYDPIDVILTNGIVQPAKLHAYQFASPGAALGAAAGTGGTVAVSLSGANETDMSFRAHLRTGNAALAAGTLFTLTFDASNGQTPYPTAPHVIFSASNASACAEIAKVYVDNTTVTTAHFLFTAGAALTANTDYFWDFMVCG